jgi:hypothetical protein
MCRSQYHVTSYAKENLFLTDRWQAYIQHKVRIFNWMIKSKNCVFAVAHITKIYSQQQQVSQQ